MTPPGGRLRGELLRGGAGTFALQIGAAVLSVGTAVVFARILGAEQYGAYAFSLAVVGLLVLPANLGIPGLVVREVAALGARREWGPLRGLLGWSARLVAATAAAVGALTAGLVVVFDLAPAPARTPLLLAAVLVPLAALVQFEASVLRGLRRVVLGHAAETVARPSLTLAIFLAVYGFVGESVDARWAVGAQVGAAALTLVALTIVTVTRLPRPVVEARPLVTHRAWLAAAVPMMLIGASQVVNVNADVVMVGAFDGARDAGIYRVSARGAQAVVFVLAAANTVLQPVVASLHARGEIDRLQAVLTRSVRMMVAVSLPVTIVLVLFGEPILRGVFGTEFETGDTALAILAVGQLVNAAVGSGGVVLTMTGHEREAARAVGIGAIANVGLNLALIPPFGIEGAAVATATSIVVWNLLLVRGTVRHLGIDPTVLGSRRARTHARGAER